MGFPHLTLRGVVEVELPSCAERPILGCLGGSTEAAVGLEDSVLRLPHLVRLVVEGGSLAST